MARALSQTIRDRRRERIVEVATEVFFAEGFGAATMQAVSQRLGGSKATLYAYFRSREDLLEAIIEAQCDRVSAELAEAAEVSGAAAQLRAIGLALMSVLVSEAGVRTLQLAIDASRGNIALAWRFEAVSVRIVTAQLAELMRGAHARGDLDAPDPIEAAQVFVALMRGDLHFRRLLGLIPEPSDAAIAEAVDRAVAVFLKAFGGR